MPTFEIVTEVLSKHTVRGVENASMFVKQIAEGFLLQCKNNPNNRVQTFNLSKAKETRMGDRVVTSHEFIKFNDTQGSYSHMGMRLN